MITKVFNHRDEVVHDCEDAGCTVSWDGYIIDADRFHAEFSQEESDRLGVGGLTVGDRVPGAVDPGEEWDTSVRGSAREVR